MNNELRERFKRVVRSQRQWATATGQSYEHVSRIMTGGYEVPGWWEPLIEFLERTPPDQWPERWKQIEKAEMSNRLGEVAMVAEGVE